MHTKAFAVSVSCLALFSVGCTKGGELIEGFGGYTGTPGETGGGGDDESDDDDGDDEDDDGGPGGPVEEGGEDPATDDGALPPAGEGDCCVGHETPGCGDAMIAECVCAQDSFCCESVWDDLCASLVVENGCGVCEGGGDEAGGTDGGGEVGGGEVGGEEAGTEGGGEVGGEVGTEGGGEVGGEVGGDGGTCCVAHPGTGCDDPMISDCVCAQDDYCCSTEWDDICVGEVDSFGCGMCGGGGTEGGGTEGGGETGGETGGGEGDCCVAHGGLGCVDADIAECVCAQDDYCCATEWDDICVGEVDSFGCGTCGGGGTEGGTEGGGEAGGENDCCVANGGLGCSDPMISDCVCAQDDYCCATEWDSLCVDEVTTFGCGTC